KRKLLGKLNMVAVRFPGKTPITGKSDKMFSRFPSKARVPLVFHAKTSSFDRLFDAKIHL
ncbi:hypothetical protein, partial [Gracilibacillus halophilus]|uniref:hypothetical protein n=1 Tax=Gracilibacillus halophilus TaxID=470864 RepID=UPI00196A1030